jgi:hypothetical protein
MTRAAVAAVGGDGNLSLAGDEPAGAVPPFSSPYAWN